jgi:hypothetical protein
LDPPLASLPLELGEWIGKDLEIPVGVQRIARNDDFVNRQYRHAQSGQVANLYVGYTGRPRTMLQHCPTDCYPSAGWLHLSSNTLSIAGVPHPVLAHLFRKPAPSPAQIVVLNYYVLNGSPTLDEGRFSDLSARDPNLRGDMTRYVAQVQVMAPCIAGVEHARLAAERFVRDSSAAIRALLPSPASAAPTSNSVSGGTGMRGPGP